MGKEACFIYNGEIYYTINATEKDIDHDLHRMVEDSLYDDFMDGPEVVVKAQSYLIQRQHDFILKNYC